MSQPDPRQHDEATAALYEAQAKADRQVMIDLNRVHSQAGDSRDRDGNWKMTHSEAQGATMPAALARFHSARREADRIGREISVMDAIYARWDWNRYFLVTNTGGHVHRNMTCSTCFPATQYAWLPELSGCDEAAMITEFGEKACTVCFPDAPADPAYHAPGRRDRAAIEARDAEKAARQAVKDAKNLTPDQVFRSGFGSRVTTVHGCKQAIRDDIEASFWFQNTYADGKYQAAAKRAIEVLLEREAAQPGTGATQEEITRIAVTTERKNARAAAKVR